MRRIETITISAAEVNVPQPLEQRRRAYVPRRDLELRNAEEARNVRRAWCFGKYRQGRRRDIAPAEEEGPRRVARRRQGEGVGRSGCGCGYRRYRRGGHARACLQRRGGRIRPPSAELQFEPRARGQRPPH